MPMKKDNHNLRSAANRQRALAELAAFLHQHLDGAALAER